MGHALGSDVYGNGVYGGDELTTLLWALEVDWDGDGVFDGSNDGLHMNDLSIDTGRDYYINSTGDGFEHSPVAVATLTLDNEDGRYDAWLPTSPLYPNVEPGKFARLRVRDGSAGPFYSVFAGTIKDIRPVESGSDRKVTIEMEDGWRWLMDRDCLVALQENASIDTILGLILDSVNWPTIWGRDLTTTDETLPYWWSRGLKASEEINNLVDSVLGTFHLANDGKATFRPRSSIPSAVLDLDETVTQKDYSLKQPWETIKNIVNVKVHPRIAQTTSVLWTLNTKPYLSTGESLTLTANFTYNSQTVPAKSLITPVAATDYTANSKDDGTGTNYTAQWTVSVTTYGQSAQIVIKNNGPRAALTKLQLRGTPLSSPDVSGMTVKGNGSDKTPREFLLDLPWQQSVIAGQDIANTLLSFLVQSKPYPRVRIESKPPQYHFGINLHDTVSLSIPSIGIIGGAFRIAKISHKWLVGNGQGIQTDLKLEPYPTNEGSWIWPTEIGVTSVFGW